MVAGKAVTITLGSNTGSRGCYNLPTKGEKIKVGNLDLHFRTPNKQKNTRMVYRLLKKKFDPHYTVLDSKKEDNETTLTLKFKV